MDLLRSGRGSEVTSDMMAAADQPYLSGIYDLPLGEASRMLRAEAMGFRTGMPLHHGTAADFQAFDPAMRGAVTRNPAAARSFWFADDPAVADEFAHLAALADSAGTGSRTSSPNVLQVYHRADRPGSGVLPRDATNESVAMTLEVAFSSGRDAVRLQNHTTPRGDVGKNIYAIPSAGQVRSRFARFDQRLAHLRNLSAGAAGAAVLTGLNPSPESAPRAYLGGIYGQRRGASAYCAPEAARG